MSIIANPLLPLLPKLDPPPPDESAPDAAKRSHGALTAVYGALLALLEAEFHTETVTATGTEIPHRLGRVPQVLIFTSPPSEARIVAADRTLWTARQIKLTASAGTPTVSFLLL